MAWIQNLISTLVGGALGIAGVVVVKFWEYCQEKCNLRSAFVGELRAILEVVDDRRLLPALEAVIAQIGTQQTPLFFPIWVGDMHHLIFRANADKLGSLRAPLPERIAGVHYRIGSVVLELQMLFEASQGRGGWLGRAVEVGLAAVLSSTRARAGAG